MEQKKTSEFLKSPWGPSTMTSSRELPFFSVGLFLKWGSRFKLISVVLPSSVVWGETETAIFRVYPKANLDWKRPRKFEDAEETLEKNLSQLETLKKRKDAYALLIDDARPKAINYKTAGPWVAGMGLFNPWQNSLHFGQFFAYCLWVSRRKRAMPTSWKSNMMVLPFGWIVRTGEQRNFTTMLLLIADFINVTPGFSLTLTFLSVANKPPHRLTSVQRAKHNMTEDI